MATTPTPQPARIATWPRNTIMVHLTEPNAADGSITLSIQRDAITTNRFTKTEMTAVLANLVGQLATLPPAPPTPTPKGS